MRNRFFPDITRGDAKVAGTLAPKNVKKMISTEPFFQKVVIFFYFSTIIAGLEDKKTPKKRYRVTVDFQVYW
jgi:hypothetical protein